MNIVIFLKHFFSSVQPFRMSPDKLFHFYVGIPVRKDAQWKDSLGSKILIHFDTVITRKLWNRKSTFKFKL